MAMMAYNTISRSEATRLLRDSLGPDADFRSDQWEAIDAIVNARKRMLVVQRTGWGKSIVYFLATRLLRMRGEGITLIVSPLISLMRNQTDHAERFGVRAVTINFSNSEEWQQHFEAIASDAIDAILISPERLANEDFIRRVIVSPTGNSNVGLLVIDEAHCISMWGHDFRPDYRRFVDTIAQLPVTLRVLGTTATATSRVVDDIRRTLGDDLVVQRGSLARETLRLQNIMMPDHSSRLAWLAVNIPRLPGSGIVYVLRKLDAKLIANWLSSKGIKARAYFAGVEAPDDNPDERNYVGHVDEYRKYLEQLLIDNRIKVMVATIALGMGFDKPDIGFVVHYQTPGSVVAYYQMVGRAGRATTVSFGILMSNPRDDYDVHEHFWDEAFPAQGDIDAILKAIAKHRNEGLTSEDLERFVNIRPRDIVKTVRHLSTREPDPPIILISGSGTKWTVNGSLWRDFQLDNDLVQQIGEVRKSEWNEMIAYTECTNQCLMTTLRSMLDDVTIRSDKSDRCDKCSNCVGHPLVPMTSDHRLAEESIAYLKRNPIFFDCKVQVPKYFDFRRCGLSLSREYVGSDHTVCLTVPENLRAKKGVALCNWMDVGWGTKVHDDKKANSLSDDLVDALANTIKRWQPWTPRKNFGWVTCVPSKIHDKLVPDFAYRLSKRLQLPFRKVVVHKEDDHAPQKTRKNNYHRCDNLDGTFKIKEQAQLLRGPVLLVDDIVRSTWTMTVIAALLQQAGSGPVFPVALARIETED